MLRVIKFFEIETKLTFAFVRYVAPGPGSIGLACNIQEFIKCTIQCHKPLSKFFTLEPEIVIISNVVYAIKRTAFGNTTQKQKLDSYLLY